MRSIANGKQTVRCGHVDFFRLNSHGQPCKHWESYGELGKWKWITSMCHQPCCLYYTALFCAVKRGSPNVEMFLSLCCTKGCAALLWTKFCLWVQLIYSFFSKFWSSFSRLSVLAGSTCSRINAILDEAYRKWEHRLWILCSPNALWWFDMNFVDMFFALDD